jgi:hypothetical protein
VVVQGGKHAANLPYHGRVSHVGFFALPLWETAAELNWCFYVLIYFENREKIYKKEIPSFIGAQQFQFSNSFVAQMLTTKQPCFAVQFLIDFAARPSFCSRAFSRLVTCPACCPLGFFIFTFTF